MNNTDKNNIYRDWSVPHQRQAHQPLNLDHGPARFLTGFFTKRSAAATSQGSSGKPKTYTIMSAANRGSQQVAQDAYTRIYNQQPMCRRQILDILSRATEPMTANEIAKRSRTDSNSTRTRLNELVQMRFIKRAGTKRDPISAFNVMAYIAVPPAECEPVSLVSGPSKRAIKAALDEVTKERDALLGRLAALGQL